MQYRHSLALFGDNKKKDRFNGPQTEEHRPYPKWPHWETGLQSN